VAKKIHYPIHEHDDPVLAERIDIRTWDIEGSVDDERLSSQPALTMFYEVTPRVRDDWKDRQARSAADPNALVAAGTHRLEIIRDKDSLDSFWEQHPACTIYETQFGGAFRKGDLPFHWGGTMAPGKGIPMDEEHAVYWFPYFGAVPVSD
jgi:hypothetical protein